MRVAFGAKLTLAFCVGLGILVLLGTLGYYSANEFSRLNREMRRRLEVEANLETVRQDVDRAELAQLRYQIKGDPAEDLEFGKIALRIEGEIEVMRGKLLAPDQKARVDQLRQAVHTRFALLAEVMEQRSSGGTATVLLFDQRSVVAARQVRDLIDTIGARQVQLTEENAERIERQARLLLHLAKWGAAFAVVLLMWSIYVILRYERDRRYVESDLKNARERLAIALDGSNSAAWDWDLPRDEIYLSAGWARIEGINLGAGC